MYYGVQCHVSWGTISYVMWSDVMCHGIMYKVSWCNVSVSCSHVSAVRYHGAIFQVSPVKSSWRPSPLYMPQYSDPGVLLQLVHNNLGDGCVTSLSVFPSISKLNFALSVTFLSVLLTDPVWPRLFYKLPLSLICLCCLLD